MRALGSRPWRDLSLAFRLTAWYTAASFTLVALATGLLYFGLSAILKESSAQFLADKVHVCRAMLRERPDDSAALHEEVELESEARQFEKFYIRVLDGHGRELLATPGMDRELSALQIAQANARDPGRNLRIAASSGRRYQAIVAEAPLGPDGRRIWTLQVALDLTHESRLLARHRAWLWTILAAAIVVCPLVGYQIAQRGIRPLVQVAETARHISSTTLNERIGAEGYPAEIAALAGTFNAMLDRLEESFARLSRFSADIAHELRTPVNNIRGESEVALARARSVGEYRDALGSCLEEAVRLSELIESLLFLARSESPGGHLNREPVDVGGLLAGVREYYEAVASEAGVTLAVADCGDVSGEIDRSLLQRALGNLVSNALAHTAAGGEVRLSARLQAQEIRIEVSDTGAGISAEVLPRVFDRFYRADPARSHSSGGAGLGLAITRQIVVLHGGDVQIASQVGHGTTVTVVLPA